MEQRITAMIIVKIKSLDNGKITLSITRDGGENANFIVEVGDSLNIFEREDLSKAKQESIDEINRIKQGVLK